MDDGLMSGNNASEIIEVITEARKVCNKGNMRLHKFSSYNKNILDSIPDSEKSDTLKALNLYTGTLPSELGVQWCTETDTFIFSIKPADESKPTCRKILSRMASVFDPSGFLSPFILEGKCI